MVQVTGALNTSVTGGSAPGGVRDKALPLRRYSGFVPDDGIADGETISVGAAGVAPRPPGFVIVATLSTGVPGVAPAAMRASKTIVTVPFGGSVTLSWAADGGAATCQGGYGWSGQLPSSGSRTLSGLKTNRGYVLTCREPLQSLLVPVKVGPAPAREDGLALLWTLDTGDIDRTLPGQVSMIDRSGNGRNERRAGS